jgi:ATP synthase protein I
MRYAGLGVQLAATILVCVLAGRWLDQRLGNTGIVTIVMVLLGFAGTLYSLIRQLNQKNGGGK